MAGEQAPSAPGAAPTAPSKQKQTGEPRQRGQQPAQTEPGMRGQQPAQTEPGMRGQQPGQPGRAQRQPGQPGDTPGTTSPTQTERRDLDRQKGFQPAQKGDRTSPTQAEPRERGQQPGRAQTPDQRGPGAATAVQLNEQQRTRIRQVIVNQNVQKVSRVNFDIRVGVRVPREEVRLFPVPATIIAIVPAYRGYLYFVLEEDDVIVIVHPTTFEIVAVIPA
jgi:hypothetical protein